MLLERRRQRREERFKQLLLSQMQAQDTNSDRVARLCSCTQEEALRISKQWLKEGILSPDQVLRFANIKATKGLPIALSESE